MLRATASCYTLHYHVTYAIASFVRQKLSHFRIPARPERGMSLGDLTMHPFEGGENIAQFVAYAASVEGTRSAPEAIRSIGLQLGEYTQKKPVYPTRFGPTLRCRCR